VTVDLEPLKREAAEAAIEAEVRSGMVLGLGTGSTAAWLLEGLGRRLSDGTLSEMEGVPTSERTAQRCRELGIPLIDLERRPSLDLAIDGADEIAPDLSLIKGLGGSHLREKVVARSAERFVVVADETKLVSRLGERAPVPVEVIPFARPLCERSLVHPHVDFARRNQQNLHHAEAAQTHVARHLIEREHRELRHQPLREAADVPAQRRQGFGLQQIIGIQPSQPLTSCLGKSFVQRMALPPIGLAYPPCQAIGMAANDVGCAICAPAIDNYYLESGFVLSK